MNGKHGHLVTDLNAAIKDHERTVICLDFDGTLVPIVDDPDAVELDGETKRILDRLSHPRDLVLAIVSGRAVEDVRDRVGLEGIRYAGNHGLEMIGEEGIWRHPGVDACREELVTALADIEDCLSEIPRVRIEDKYATASIHYRNVPAGRTSEVHRIVRERVETAETLAVSWGKQVIQIRPAVDWDKGDAIRRIVEPIAGDVLVIALGDDMTDADGFAAVRSIDATGVCIAVDNRTLPADYRMEGPHDVRRWLTGLLGQA